MGKVVVLGAGMNGLTTAMLLAKDGHEVTVVERDPAVPPAPESAWDEWERRGVTQFRQLHYLAPRWRQIIEAELPALADAFDRATMARPGFFEAVIESGASWRDAPPFGPTRSELLNVIGA